MGVVRVHVRMGTVDLPTADLNTVEQIHGVIDIACGDNERLMQLDVHESAAYRRAKFMGSSDLIRQGEEVNVRDRTKSTFRYRAILVEEISATDASTVEAVGELPAGSVTDATLVSETDKQ